MHPRPLSLMPVGLVALLVLALSLPTPADAAPGASFEGATATEAWEHLELLGDRLKSRRATNDDLIVDIQIVLADYLMIEAPVAPVPQVVPDGARREERDAIAAANREAEAAHKAAVRTFRKHGGKFQAAVEKALLKALALEKQLRRRGPNIRNEVNIAAARALAATGNPAVSAGIRKVLEREIFGRDPDAPESVLDAVFSALGDLGDLGTLEWMSKEFIHTRSSPQRDVDRLVAAHQGMLRFEDPPGELRYAIVHDMLKLYTGVESQAEQSSNIPAIQSSKRFWDQVKNGAIRVVQQFAGEPRDEDGRGLATMRELRDWFRDHDDRRKAPWFD